jgi:putative GTP pyrophosphokinase
MNESNINWLQFLQPYELAVSGFVMKLESIKKQYILSGKRCPIENVTGRVKNPKSIVAKLKRMNMDFSEIRNLSDIGGIRITCKYIQEVYEIFDLIKSRKDVEIFWIKDYIENPKPSGYRSLHIIAKYNAETIDGQMPINIEFQIRTLAMHLWGSIEHSLKYKYYRNIPENIKLRLIEASRIAYDLDVEMSMIKKEMNLLDVKEEREEEYENSFFEYDYDL